MPSHSIETHSAYIIGATRTPVGRGKRGSLVHFRPDSMAAQCIQSLLRSHSYVDPHEIEDLILGCAMPEAEQGMNMARMVCLEAGLPDTTCGITINRYCSSGLQAISMAADRIRLGETDLILAGGTESMSMIPFGGHKVAPNPNLMQNRPEAYMAMGLTAERVAEKFQVSREQQDAFALQSHKRATNALEQKLFQEEITPLSWDETHLNDEGKPVTLSKHLEMDEGPRADTSLDALADLKPVFKVNGTVTAGNSSQVSDGASMLLLASESYVRKHNLSPLARFVRFAVEGVPPEIMGIGPALAIPKVLNKSGFSLSDIKLYEINEAFASQTLAVLKELHLSEENVNVNGGAIALGHPLGCTGAKLSVQLIHELKRRGGGNGIVSMCIGGGMGAAGVLEVFS